MNKPKLLYASPFPPKKSGISDYSTVLVKALEKRFEITLLIEDYEISDATLKKFPVARYGVDEIDFNHYDYYIYNIGNNPEYHKYIYQCALEHPGMIILHDMVIYYLFVGYYQDAGNLYSSVYNKQGIEDFLTIKEAVKKDGPALLEQKHMADKLALNKELIMSGNKIMVHSKYAYETIMNTGLINQDLIRQINLIAQIDKDTAIVDKGKLFRKYNIPKDAFIISSFGYIAGTKLNKEVCHAVRKLKEKLNKKIVYLMVGEGNYVDDELEDGFIIKTGFTELDEFNSFVGYSDIIVNLRYPSMGETSGAMLRILQMGKACITNNGGWFSELPDDCVCKIELNDVVGNLEKALVDLIENENTRRNYEMNAKKYVEEKYGHDLIANKIYEFITEK